MILAFLLFSMLLACGRSNTGVTAGARGGGTASDFELRDLKGEDISLSSFKGKVVLLEFWATWCPPCRATVSELRAIQDKYRAKGLIVLGISVDEGPGVSAKLAEFAKQFNVNYLILLGSPKVARAYNVTSIPTSFLIDRNGKIVNTHIGYIDDFQENISKEIDRLI